MSVEAGPPYEDDLAYEFAALEEARRLLYWRRDQLAQAGTTVLSASLVGFPKATELVVEVELRRSGKRTERWPLWDAAMKPASDAPPDASLVGSIVLGDVLELEIS